MFDLEKAIAEWRRRMTEGGINSPEILDELESHLRDEFERIRLEEMPLDLAFRRAELMIGPAPQLRREFSIADHHGWFYRVKFLLARLLGRAVDVDLPWSAEVEECLFAAPVEARRFGHHFVGTEHLLLGLLNQPDGVAMDVVKSFGLSRNAIRAEIETIVGTGPKNTVAGAIPLTPRAKKALHLAQKEAGSLKQPRTGAQHLLLGLLRENSGVAGLVLRRLGISATAAREEILKRGQ